MELEAKNCRVQVPGASPFVQTDSWDPERPNQIAHDRQPLAASVSQFGLGKEVGYLPLSTEAYRSDRVAGLEASKIQRTLH